MKFIILLFSVLLLSSAIADDDNHPTLREFDPLKWPELQLDLSNSSSLKAVFDSGLRPYRFPGLEASMLESKHVQLQVVLDRANPLPEVATEWIHFKVYNDSSLSTIQGSTPPLSIQEAREAFLSWKGFGDWSVEDLDHFLDQVSADPVSFDSSAIASDRSFGAGWKVGLMGVDGGEAHVGVGFKRTFSSERPLRFQFSISWISNRRARDRVSYKIPIPPPEGYEHVDMEAPELFGPDSQAEILRSAGVDIGDGSGGTPHKSFSKKVENRSIKAGGEIDQKPSIRSRKSLWYQVLAIIAMFFGVGSLWWIIIARRTKDSITRRRS